MESVFGYEYEPAAHLVVTDEDAADFLQSQFSNELRPFDRGRCTYGLWLDVKGRVIADSYIFCEGTEAFRILSEHCTSSVIAQKLEQHIIADDVVVEVLPNGSALTLVGEGAVAVLEQLGIEVPPSGRVGEAAGLFVYRGRRAIQASFEMWSETPEAIAELKERLIALGVEFTSAEQMQLTRMAAGVPSVPDEIGPRDLPGEGSLVGNAVSLTKGCYLGQEVVARMHNVGRPQRALFLISGTGETPSCPIELHNEDSKKIGELRSAVQAECGWRGVALLKIRYASVGASLGYEGHSVCIEANFATNAEVPK